MLLNFLVVGIGGFLGSCLRFGLTKGLQHLGGGLPLGTLLSNVIAGVAIGFIMGLEQPFSLSPRMKTFLTTGLLGGLSTFSTFSFETIRMLRDGHPLLATGNVFLNLSLSLLGVVLGMVLAKLLFVKG